VRKKRPSVRSLLPKDYFEGAKKTVANARLQFGCAVLLAEHRDAYGPACSLMIQSWEEANKAHSLMAAALGNKKAVEDLDNVFSKHWRKHELGLIALMPDTAAKIMKTVKAKSPEDLLSSPLTIAEMDPYGHVQWSAHAGWLREEGFYVDYYDGRWLSPADVSAEQFALSKEVACKRLIEVEVELAETEPVFAKAGSGQLVDRSVS
jgi:AbiV family abortive infection protein